MDNKAFVEITCKSSHLCRNFCEALVPNSLKHLRLYLCHTPLTRFSVPLLPTIVERGVQAMVKNALEPFWEARFEGISDGFRPGRGCHDAIQKIFYLVRPNTTRPWVFDADIEGAFDYASCCLLQESKVPNRCSRLLSRCEGRGGFNTAPTAGVYPAAAAGSSSSLGSRETDTAPFWDHGCWIPHRA